MGAAGQQIGQTTNELDEFDDKAEATSNRLRQVLVTAFVLAGAAAANFARQAIQEFAEFDQKIHEVYTLIPDASEQFKGELSNDIRDVGLQFGRLTDETVPALYQALSAGLPKENAIEAVGVASQAATAGVADLEGTMKTGMAVVNAYGGEVYTLEQVYDILFTLIKNGVVTMGELNSSLSRVTSVAAESRTPFEDIAAALVVMTRQGDSAAEATELLSFLLIQLGTDGTAAAETFADATGMAYRDWIATGHTLIEGLQELQKHADTTGESLASMIGGDTKFFRDMQAGRAIIELTGYQLDNMVEQGQNMQQAAGAMGEAFTEASDNIQFEMDKAKASLEDAKISLGELILNAEILGGHKVSGAITGFTLLIQALSGALARNAMSQWVESLPKEPDFADALEGMRKMEEAMDFKAIITLGPEGTKEMQRASVELLAATASNYEAFYNRMSQSPWTSNAFNWGDWAQDLGAGSPMLDFGADAMLGGHRNLRLRMDASGELVSDIYNEIRAQQQLIETEQIVNYSRETLANNMRNLLSPEETAAIQRAEEYANANKRTSLETRLLSDSLDEQAFAWYESNKAAEAGIFVVEKLQIEYTHLSSAQVKYISAIKQASGELQTAMEAYADAQGEWQTVTVDNAFQISSIQQQLNADLTDDQREMYEDILNNAEEGGAEWVNAYNATQNDLNTSQRRALVARLADLEANQGKAVNILNIDKAAAEEAGGAILEAYEAINQAWISLAQEIAVNKIADELEGETKEAALATLELERAMGTITDEQYDFLTRQLDQSTALKPILDEMLTQYLEDAVLSKEEADHLAEAIDIVNQNAGILTDEGLRELINASIDPIDGIPAIGAVLHEQVVEKTREAKEEADKFADDEYIPEFGIDATEYEEGLEEILRTARAATDNPWVMRFVYSVEGEPPRIPRGVDSGQHTGTTGFTVPGGYNRDNFIMGLSSGEFVTVTTPGQMARGQGPGGGQAYIDNRDQRIFMVNNGAGAARVARAWIEMKRQQRINTWLGG